MTATVLGHELEVLDLVLAAIDGKTMMAEVAAYVAADILRGATPAPVQ